MKYLSLLLIAILLLSLSSCGCKNAGNVGEDPSESTIAVEAEDLEDPENSASANKPPPDNDYGYAESLTPVFVSLCREAVQIADEHIKDRSDPEGKQQRFQEIMEKMNAESDNLPEGISSTLGFTASYCVMTLYGLVIYDSQEQNESFINHRNQLATLANEPHI